MGQVRWSATATLAGLFSLLLTGGLLFSVTRSARESAAHPLPDPHATPLDFADATVRSAIDVYGKFTLGRGLESIAADCSRGKEIYRAVTLPAFGKDTTLMAVDFNVAGGQGAVTTRKFGPTGGGDYAWQVAAQRVVGLRDADAIRDAAARLLLSGLPAAIDDNHIDQSDWVIETCRNERYHFFRRRSAEAFPENEPFVSMVRTLLVLRRPGEN